MKKDEATGEMVGEERPSILTHATPQEMFEALSAAWSAAPGEGQQPTRESFLVLLAQWALETGWGHACRNWNIGNAKATPHGDTWPIESRHDWTFYSCNEVLSPTGAQRAVADARPRIDGMGPDAVIYTNKPGVVWFYPNNPACCFRSFETLAEGAHDYLDLLSHRFHAAWPAMLDGDPAGFAHVLKEERYYTASEEAYTRTLTSVFESLRKSPDYELRAEPHVSAINVGAALGIVQTTWGNLYADLRAEDERALGSERDNAT